MIEGIEVKAMISFNEEDDNNVGRISQDSIEKAALEIGQNPEAYFSKLRNEKELLNRI